jgi:hypothetical protein
VFYKSYDDKLSKNQNLNAKILNKTNAKNINAYIDVDELDNI